MNRKNFIKIERLREHDEEFEGIVFQANCLGFVPGHIISITEKIDGANTSVGYDEEDGRIHCFSSKNEITELNTLRGFYSYVMKHKNFEGLKNYPTYIVFGEWEVPHTIIYPDEVYRKWYVYSIWDKKAEVWLDQQIVKDLCKELGFEYIHELYYGEFISWDHCRTFLTANSYGDQQEGIVVRDLTALEDPKRRYTHILKIVNPRFKEIKHENHIRKIEDPYKLEEKAKAQEIINSIVTEARVRKIFLKYVDEGVIPEDFKPSDMKVVCKVVPKAVYEDCLEEEPELLKAAGEYGGKMVSHRTVEIIKEFLGMTTSH